MKRMCTKKFARRILSCACAASMLLSSSAISTLAYAKEVNPNPFKIVNKTYAGHESLQPRPYSLSISTILNWTPEIDPDARYSRSSVKLTKKRVTGPLVNKLANPNAKLQICPNFNVNHDNAASQGSETFAKYTPCYWQYINSAVYWAGSTNGIFVVPSADVIDAAHKNGVPVIATIGFPWGRGGQKYIDQVNAFCQKADDGSFPVADKMIQIAKYYGFDGYFINQESYGCNEKTMDRLMEMMQYVHTKDPQFIWGWYDAMANDGEVNYQNAVNEYNDKTIKPNSNGIYASDELFMNYNWGEKQIQDTIATMKKYGRNPFDAFAGVEMQANSYNTQLRDNLLVDKTGKLKISMTLFAADSTLGVSKDPVDFHNAEQKLYVGPSGDPFVHPDNPADKNAPNWLGMSQFFADKTVITSAPFVTNFNTGHGKKYFIDGQLKKDNGWNNRSIQDIMPTWTWHVTSQTSDKLSAAYDFETAYNGGNSVKLYGKLNGKNKIMLYSTAVDNAKTAEITYKTTDPNAKVQLGVCTGNDYNEKNFTYYDLKKASKAGEWTTASVSLAGLAGKKVIALALTVDGKSENFQLNIGRMALLGEKSELLAAPEKTTLDEFMYTSDNTASARIYWQEVKNASYYELYQTIDGKDVFLNATPNTAFYLPKLLNEKKHDNVSVKIVPVSSSGVRGKAAVMNIDWKKGLGIASVAAPIPTAKNVCLNAKIIDIYPNEGKGEPAHKALDGTTEGNSKWCATVGRSGLLSIDVGEPKTIRRIRVVHDCVDGDKPSEQEANCRKFAFYYANDSKGPWTKFKEVDYGVSSSDRNYAFNDIVLNEKEAPTARYFKYVILDPGPSPWAHAHCFEWQMFEDALQPPTASVNSRNASAVNRTGANDTFTLKNVRPNFIVRLYKTADAKVPYKQMTADQTGIVSFQNLDFGADSGRIYYTVQRPHHDAAESDRLSTIYLAENASKSHEIKLDSVGIKPYSAVGSKSSSYGNYIFTTLTFKNLKPGDVVSVYENKEDESYFKQSLPVEKGANSVSIDRIPILRNKGKIVVSLKESGKLPSEKEELFINENFPEPQAVLNFSVVNENKSVINKAAYGIYEKNSNKEIKEVSCDNGQIKNLSLPLGEYVLRSKSLPDGCTDPIAEHPIILKTEGAVVPLQIQLKTNQFAVNTGKEENGNITVSSKTARVGDKVKISTNAPKGWQVVKDSIEAKCNGNKIHIEKDGSFIMPNGEVTVSAKFSKIPEAKNETETGNGVGSPSSTSNKVSNKNATASKNLVNQKHSKTNNNAVVNNAFTGDYEIPFISVLVIASVAVIGIFVVRCCYKRTDRKI